MRRLQGLNRACRNASNRRGKGIVDENRVRRKERESPPLIYAIPSLIPEHLIRSLLKRPINDALHERGLVRGDSGRLIARVQWADLVHRPLQWREEHIGNAQICPEIETR